MWFPVSLEGLGERRPSPGDLDMALYDEGLPQRSLMQKCPYFFKLFYLMEDMNVYILLRVKLIKYLLCEGMPTKGSSLAEHSGLSRYLINMENSRFLCNVSDCLGPQ